MNKKIYKGYELIEAIANKKILAFAKIINNLIENVNKMKEGKE